MRVMAYCHNLISEELHVVVFQVVGRYRHQIQRVLLPDLYQTLQESR
jgi:hypothetical protein